MSEETLLSVSGILNKRVFVEKKENTFRRIGKVRRFVFHPTEKRVIGIIVKRPDAALMFHRHDLFVAVDRMEVVPDGVIVDDSGDSVDQKACRRLGVQWAKCLLWIGMEIVTEGGQVLGRVGDVAFHANTGQVEAIRRDEGATARWLLGVEEIPARLIRGFRFGVGSQMADYEDGGEEGGGDLPTDADDTPAEEVENYGAIVVSDEVLDLDSQGGLAERAGTATAMAAHKGKQALAQAKEAANPKMEELGEKAGEALNKGAYATGRQLGRAKGMFSGFMNEYRKAMRDDEE